MFTGIYINLSTSASSDSVVIIRYFPKDDCKCVFLSVTSQIELDSISDDRNSQKFPRRDMLPDL